MQSGCRDAGNARRRQGRFAVGRHDARRAVRSARGAGGAGGSVSRARAINRHELRGNEVGQAVPQRYAHDGHDKSWSRGCDAEQNSVTRAVPIGSTPPMPMPADPKMIRSRATREQRTPPGVAAIGHAAVA